MRAGAAHDEHLFHAFRTLDGQRFIGSLLQRNALAAAQPLIRGDE